MWRRSISKAIVLLALMALLSPATVRAATFSVDPIIVKLAKGGSSESVAITNDSNEKLRLQVTGYSWREGAGGEMQLTPTDDLVFFPQLLELAPGETRRVRIGVTADQGAVEKTFRVFMEELPSLASVVSPKQNAITIRMKVGIPVFVSAIGAPVISGSVRDAAAYSNALSFDVVNTGNTHFSIQQVHVVGKSAAGGDIVSRDVTGWYLLPGGTRRFTIPLGKDSCAELRSLAIQVKTDSVTFANTFPDLSKQCAIASRR